MPVRSNNFPLEASPEALTSTQWSRGRGLVGSNVRGRGDVGYVNQE